VEYIWTASLDQFIRGLMQLFRVLSLFMNDIDASKVLVLETEKEP
jgi:hypothetical protein